MCKDCPEKLKDTEDCQHLLVGWVPLDALYVDPKTYRFWTVSETAFNCDRPTQEDNRKWVRAVCAKNTIYLDAADIHIADLFPVLCQKGVPRPEHGCFDVAITTAIELHMAFIRTRATTDLHE